jgi:NADH dehydrogenase (ubiquinone) 1 alpha subcomplex subunit 5
MRARCRYRKVVESLCKGRLDVVKASASIGEIEEKIGAGQVEQLIHQVTAMLKCPL